MPNWATGTVTVTGEKNAIASFIGRFVSHDEQSTIPGKKYFARSFLEDYRANLIQEIPDPDRDGDQVTFTFPISFAWSAYSCIISGYPERFKEDCLTLSEACVLDHVSVEIRTIEYGMCFEEEIFCSADGDLEHTSQDLREVKCPNCGNIQSIGSIEDPEESYCWECGNEGMDLVETEDK